MNHFLFSDNIEKLKKNLRKVLKTFENIIENLLQKSKCSIFHNIFKYMIFQRCLKELLWSKRLKEGFCSYEISTKIVCAG